MGSERPRISAYRALELRTRIHTADRVVFVFRGLDKWVRHVVRHFGNRQEPWARILKEAAPHVFSLRDQVPGNTEHEKVAFLDQLDCQNDDQQTVSILRAACEAYAKVGPVILEQLNTGLKRPRYAHFPHSNPLARSHAGGHETTYVIAEPFPAIIVVRGADVRTCYFIAGIRGVAADMPAVQSHLFRRCGMRRSSQTWVDRFGSPAYPYTERTLRWDELSMEEAPTRSRQFRRPSGAGRW